MTLLAEYLTTPLTSDTLPPRHYHNLFCEVSLDDIRYRKGECIRVSVPGRICLQGEHQDFLGLPVIAMAVDRCFNIKAWPRPDNKYVIHMPDLATSAAGTVDARADRNVCPTDAPASTGGAGIPACPDSAAHDEFVPSQPLTYRHHRDYLPSAVNVLKQRGLEFDRGYDFLFTSTIPVNAGCSSSSAMCVGWIKTLLALANDPAADDPKLVARLAHQAEVLEFHEPGGTMDHYTTSIGGLLYIETTDPIQVTPINPPFEMPFAGFVLGNTLEKKDTKATLRASRQAAEAGIAQLARRIPGFSLRTTPTAQIQAELPHLATESADILLANVINRDLCQEAARILKTNPFDATRFGQLIDEHHAQLRDRLHISTPALERLIQAAHDAGAFGAKLNGSGGGGTMIAFAPNRDTQIAAAIGQAGGKAYVVRPCRGATIEFKAEGI